MMVPLAEEEEKDCRLLMEGFRSVLSAKTSMSNFSASNAEGRQSAKKPSPGGEPEGGSGKKEIAMSEYTSCARRPNI
jgi:hypothetical protein